MDIGASEAGAQLLGQRLHVVGSRCNVPFVCHDPGIALLHGITAQKDYRIGRCTFGCSAIEGENVDLAVDLDSNSSRTVAIGWRGFNTLNHFGTEEGSSRQVRKDWKSNHAFN